MHERFLFSGSGGTQNILSWFRSIVMPSKKLLLLLSHPASGIVTMSLCIRPADVRMFAYVDKCVAKRALANFAEKTALHSTRWFWPLHASDRLLRRLDSFDIFLLFLCRPCCMATAHKKSKKSKFFEPYVRQQTTHTHTHTTGEKASKKCVKFNELCRTNGTCV